MTTVAVCLGLMLVVPFVLPFNTLPVITFYQEWAAFALGCALLLAVVWQLRTDSIAVPRTVFLPAGICLLLLVQALMGSLGYWQVGATGAIYLVWSLAMLCAGAMLRQSLGRDSFCALAAAALLVGALLSAVAGLLQLAQLQLGGLIMPMTMPRVHANLAQSNHFANYVCLGLFSLCFLAAGRKLNVIIAVTAAALMLLAADLSASRSVWVYLLTATALALWTHYQARSEQSRALVYWLGGVLVGMVIVSALTTALWEHAPLFADSMQRHGTGTERLLADSSAVSHRQSIWLVAWQMFQSNPLTGAGYGAFAWEYFLALGRLPAGLPEEIVDHAHNVVLQMLAEFGLAGGLLLVAAAVAWCWSAVRHEATTERWWMLTMVSVIVLHGLVEYPLWYAHFLGLFALLVGAGDHVQYRLKPAFASPTVLVGAGAVMLWLLSSVYLDYRLVERLGVESARVGDNRKAIVAAAEAAPTSLFGNFVELGLSRTIALNRDALDAKLELNGRVLRSFPAPDVAFRQSALHAMQGDVESAEGMWDLAASAYPGHSAAVLDGLAGQLAMGEVALKPLVEYAASRNGASRGDTSRNRTSRNGTSRNDKEQ
ncbi:MAG: O-antigen ligase C-terminal domain-containing protein [Betaproteobacteria bacterium]|nr:MAG: O-antigen ligase C-terminal domain-containing protein [Betaproteobacteria bacterium]